MASKLVRDKIPDLMRAKGANSDAISHASGPEEMVGLLLDKLEEELDEVHHCLCLEELADMQQVIIDLASWAGLGTQEDLEAVRHGKYVARGGFEYGVVLDLDRYEGEPSNGAYCG